MSFLTLNNVSVAFNVGTVVDNVSFAVEKGEIASIIGPNGSGKTTLIRAMLGLEKYEGSIELEGIPISKQLKSIGYIPQKFDFDKTFPMTVREFLNLTKALHSEGEPGRMCREVQIENILSSRLGDLSGGQLQRVMIAQSVLTQPKLLILDEPTTGVDIEGARSFYEIVRHLNQKHAVTIILVSHEIAMVVETASTVICLNKKILCFGHPKKVITKELLDHLYGVHLKN